MFGLFYNQEANKKEKKNNCMDIERNYKNNTTVKVKLKLNLDQ